MTNKSLDVVRGDDKYYIINITDGAGLPIDITGWTVFLTIKEDTAVPDEEAIISKTITDHMDPTNGKSKIHLANTETNHVGTYYYDIQIKKPSGGVDDIFTVLSGEIEFKQDVTQRTAPLES
jgi:hypothetical protein